MESGVFEFSIVKESENFGIKVYKDSIYRGELNDGKR